MSIRNLFTTALLALALGSLVYTFVIPRDEPGVITSPTRPMENTVIRVEGVDPAFAVYFFYNDIYCSTCEKLENYALSTIQADYAGELSSGMLQWRTLDMRTSENKHYIEEFSLYSKSIVLVAFENQTITRFKNLEGIWDKVGEEMEYRSYIRENLKTFMQEAS